MMVAAFAVTFAFRVGIPGPDGAVGATLALHAVLAALFFAGVASLEPALKSLASLHLPMEWQGRSFAVLASASGTGAILGNTLWTRLYQAAKGAAAPASAATADGLGAPAAILAALPGETGALPFALIGALLVLAALIATLVSGISRVHERELQLAPLDDSREAAAPKRLFGAPGKTL